MRRRDSKSFSRELHYHPPMRKSKTLLVAAVGVVCVAATLAGQRPSVPPTTKGDVVDDYFGTTVADPYRWMEDLDSKAVSDWIAAQNAVTSRYLEALPMRDKIKARITQLWDYPKTGTPFLEAGRVFYRRNSGLQKQSPLYMRASLTAPPACAPRPKSTLARRLDLAGGHVPVAGRPDARLHDVGRGRRLAGGTRPRSRVQPRCDGCHKWMRFSGFAWTGSKGFFYSRYPEPPAGKVLEAALSGQALDHHRLGTEQSADRLIYERKDLPGWFIGGDVTEDGRYLRDHDGARILRTRTG